MTSMTDAQCYLLALPEAVQAAIKSVPEYLFLRLTADPRLKSVRAEREGGGWLVIAEFRDGSAIKFARCGADSLVVLKPAATDG